MNTTRRQIKDCLNKSTLLPYFVIFGISFLAFLLLQSAPTFPDPDSFYHVKIAELMAQQGIVKDFPWTQYSVLKDFYIDHHFLYHVALIPFVKLLPPMLGVKLATVFFAGMFMVTFFWFLKKLDVRYASMYTYILLGTNAFIFRLNLAKAQSLALIFLFIGIYFLLEKKYVYLFLLSFFYVWLYGGWPLMLFVAMAYSLAEIPFFFSLKKPKIRTEFYKFWRFFSLCPGTFVRKLSNKIKKDAAYLFVITFGLVAGIILSPYFPKNIDFYWQQIFQIAIVNYKETIGVGGEWYAYNPIHLIAHSRFAFLLFVAGITFFIFNVKNQTRKTVFLFLLSFIFLFLTYRSRRNAEYFIPFSVAFSALSIDIFLKRIQGQEFLKELREFVLKKKLIVCTLFFIFGAGMYFVVADIQSVKKAYNSGFDFTYLKDSSEWLLKNSEKNDIVFTSDWDDFTFLFKNNTHNYYIVGLDPTFMYAYDRDLYTKWERVTMARDTRNMYSIIKDDFKAKFVFVSLSKHLDFDKLLLVNNHFKEVYRDTEASIYQIL